MIAFSNAKINLGLNIIAKREDGFHNLETIFLPIAYKDILEILPLSNGIKNQVQFNSTGLEIAGSTDSNLCVKAYNLLVQQVGELPSIQIHLHKQVPMGAGLGGGSANGSEVLKMLVQLFKLKITPEKLIDLSLQLGSDCPFFIINKPCFATSRGEVLQAIEIQQLQNYKVVLVNPKIHINTGWAFNNITPNATNHCLKNIIEEPIENWQHKIINDFEKPVFMHYPEIAAIKQTLLNFGCVFASLTGTGSTVFGLIHKHLNTKEVKPLFPENYFVEVVDFI